MPAGILVYSPYCPFCELFRHGSALFKENGELIEVRGQGGGTESAWSIVRSICSAVKPKIPTFEIDISTISGWEKEEIAKMFIPVFSEEGFRRLRIPRQVVREELRKWVEVDEKKPLPLPGFLVKSTVPVKDRFFNLEVARTNPFIALDWSAARQCLRELARARIWERFIVLFGLRGKENTYENRELVLHRLFPINEVGKPSFESWIGCFNLVNHLKAENLMKWLKIT